MLRLGRGLYHHIRSLGAHWVGTLTLHWLEEIGEV